MVPTIYLETSIISYLAAQPSRDLITAARQQITHEWWGRRRHAFQLFVSELVLVETSRGDVDAAARRLAWVDGIEVVDIVRLPRISPIRFFAMHDCPNRPGQMHSTLR